MNINSVGMYNNCPCPDCNKKNSPAFGMAMIFKPEAILRLRSTLSHSVPETMDTFSKEVLPLIKKSGKNPVNVIVDVSKDNDYLLKATVEDKSLGIIGEYTQSAMFDYKFLKDSVKRAEHVNKLNNELNNHSDKK